MKNKNRYLLIHQLKKSQKFCVFSLSIWYKIFLKPFFYIKNMNKRHSFDRVLVHYRYQSFIFHKIMHLDAQIIEI